MLEQGLLIMLGGMGGIFLVMTMIYGAIKLLNFFTRSKSK
ncbi:OadG family protein [Niameybacter sp.]